MSSSQRTLQFLGLPLEIIHNILSLLSPIELTTCQLINKYLDAIISESLVLQYTIALALAMARDDPSSIVPLSQRLENIRSGEAAWASLQPKFIASLPVRHPTSGIYDLSAGTYLQGNVDRKTLQYLQLPTQVDDPLDWKNITMDKAIIDMGFCVYEHDLIAIITSTSSTTQPGLLNIEMTLLEYSTGKPHPKAKNSTIFVTSPSTVPALMCEIVGNNLILILNFLHDVHHDDRIFIWDWCSDVLITAFSVPRRTYSGLLFLEEDLIILPNAKSAAFDFFRIPIKPTVNTLKPFFSLQLPSLADGMEIDNITCRAEPNPIGDTSRLNKRQRAQERADVGLGPFAPKRGFLASGEDAICLFHICFRDATIVIPGGINLHFEPTSSYTLFVHRSSFLKMARQYEETCNVAFDSGRIPWVDWGPPVSRWFNALATPTRWITTSAGQRCAMIHDDVGVYGSPITILDFNPFNVRKMKAKLKREKERAKGKLYQELKSTTGGVGSADEEDWSSSGSEIEEPSSSCARSQTRMEIAINMHGDPTDISFFSGVIGEMDAGEDEDDESLDSMDNDTDSDIFVGYVPGDADSDSMPGLESVVHSDEERNTRSARYTTNPQDHRHPGFALCRVSESPSRESSGTFTEEVEGRLPYIRYVSEREYEYKGVLLDEERILGLMTDSSFCISAIDIFYFG